jgi:hypothetical protein
MKGIRTTLVVIGTDCIWPLAINEMRTSSVSEGAKIKVALNTISLTLTPIDNPFIEEEKKTYFCCTSKCSIKKEQH